MTKTGATAVKTNSGRSPGRPVDPRKDAVIRDVAGQLFMVNGVQGTTMDQIAQGAGVSKLTLYRKYPDKNALFMAVVGCKCDDYMPESLFELGKTSKAEEVLGRIGVALMELTTHDDGVNLHRILSAEAGRNPELGEQFACGLKRLKECMRNTMAEIARKGLLKIEDPEEASGFFVALLMGSELVKHANLGIGKRPTRPAMEAYVKKAVKFFLKAYA
ncbi:MAG TPA: TetR/AcrR family transcriptional regulator C-terminal domain-containing protein [Alphaproteobacteria bacterium]|nr:TetR/AcrR family transcriptional regulator C-terminal domain-containing protein [Alphaproteobacteria bacterium]